MDGQPDLVCLPVAALQHRRDHVPRCHRCDWSHVRRSDCRPRLPLRVQVTARTDNRSGTATSNPTAVVQPTTPVTNARPTLRILKVTFLGARIYVRIRVCDDQPRNLGILVRETRPGVRPALRRFATRVRAASVRCVYAKLASGRALPWPWSLHDHAASTGRLGPDEPAGDAHVPQVTTSDGGWHRAAAAVPATAILPLGEACLQSLRSPLYQVCRKDDRVLPETEEANGSVDRGAALGTHDDLDWRCPVQPVSTDIPVGVLRFVPGMARRVMVRSSRELPVRRGPPAPWLQSKDCPS